jgi:type II secretory pathway pseudopilin PulG
MVIHRSKIKKAFRGRFGFTIIELMFVIAAAGLITVIVFIAVPELQRSERDHYRKTYAGDIIQAAAEYIKNNDRLPFCTNEVAQHCASAPSDAARFISNYLPDGSDPLTGLSWSSKNTHVGSTPYCTPAVFSEHDSTVYCFSDTAAHGYIDHKIFPNLGQLVLVEDHICCPCDGPNFTASAPGDSVGHGYIKLNSKGGFDNAAWDFDDRIAVLIGTEHGYYCVTNDANHDFPK